MLCGMDTRNFKGFDDYIEIFRSGTHTDSQGRTATYTNADLDEVVANHSADDAAPAVIGHPKTDDPAYGWTDKLKRVGDSLFARFRDIDPEFAENVEAGRYRKRSVRLINGDNGWQLAHVGWLGAKRPALTLQAMNYEEPEGEVFDFESDAYTPGVLSRILRRLREHFIDKFDIDTANNLIPSYEIDSLADYANKVREEDSPAFSEPSHKNKVGAGDMPPKKDYTEDDLKAARDEERKKAEAEFAEKDKDRQQELDKEKRARLTTEFQSEIDGLVDEGKLLPAQTVGMADFVAQLGDGEDAQFEFSEGDETKKKTPLDWFRDFATSLGKQIDLSESAAGGTDGGLDMQDANALAKAAGDFQSSEKEAGRDITLTAAMHHVTQGQS
jgi:hypothetical protein